MIRALSVLGALVVASLTVVLPAGPVAAVDYTAGNASDLRDRIDDAEASVGPDLITLTNDITLDDNCAVVETPADVVDGGDLDYVDNSDLTIDGAGFTISACASGGRVLHLRTEGTVTLRDLTITGGRLAGGAAFTQGGGVFLELGGELVLDGASITDNEASSETVVRGGGLATNGALTMQNGSVISNNRALGVDGTSGGAGTGTAGTAGGAAFGGGVYAGGLLNITDATLSSNEATGGAGGNGGSGSAGTNGTAGTVGGPGGAGGDGGSVQGAAIVAPLGGTISDSTFIDNVATAGPGGSGGGGGAGGDGTTGDGAAGGAGGAGGLAGGVSGYELLVTGGDLSITNSTSTGATGTGAAGGAGGNGGAGGDSDSAVAGDGGAGGNPGTGSTVNGSHGRTGGAFTVINSTFSSLTASGGSGGTGGSGGAGGTSSGTSGNGGIATNGAFGGSLEGALATSNSLSPFTVTDTVIDTYVATSGQGGNGGSGGIGGVGGGTSASGAFGGQSGMLSPAAIDSDSELIATNLVITTVLGVGGNGGNGGGSAVSGGAGGPAEPVTAGAVRSVDATITDSSITNITLVGGDGGNGGSTPAVGGGTGSSGADVSGGGVTAIGDLTLVRTKVDSVTLTGGAGGDGANSGNGFVGGDATEGGVSQTGGAGSLTLTASSITNVSVTGGNGGNGGTGISSGDGSAGGSATDAGVYSAAPAVLENTTIAGNTATAGTGGTGAIPGSDGISTTGGLHVAGTISANHVTIVGNGGGVTGNLQFDTSSTFDGVVIGDALTGADCTGPGGLSFFSASYSGSTDGTCPFSAGNNLGTSITTDLGALADNGGGTLSMMPAAASILIDASNCAGVVGSPAADQIAMVRPQGSGCDVGAIERDAGGPVVSSMTVTPDPSVEGDDLTVTAQLDDPQGSAITGVNVSFEPKSAKALTITADDGNFDSSSEAMTAVLTDFLNADVYNVCITATDVFGNASAVTCKEFTVNTPAPPPDPGSACPDPVADFFPDDNGDIHEPNINCIAFWKITGGKADGTYDPGGNVTRAQMATFIANKLRTAGVAVPDDAPDAFPDDNGTTHETNINAIKALGVAGGKADGTYDPSGFVTRAQMATFIANAAAKARGAALPAGPDAFPDDNGNTHEANINALALAKIVGGKAGGIYDPNGLVTRAQMGTFIANCARVLFTTGDWPNANA